MNVLFFYKGNMDNNNNCMNLQENSGKEKKYICKNFHISQTQYFKDSSKQKEKYSNKYSVISTNRYTKLVEKPKHSGTFKEDLCENTLVGKNFSVLHGATEKAKKNIFKLTSNYTSGSNIPFNYFNHNCHHAYNKNKYVANIRTNKNRSLVTYDQNRQELTERKSERKQERKQELEKERENGQEKGQEKEHNKEKGQEEEAAAKKELDWKGNLIRKDTDKMENLKREAFYVFENSTIEKNKGENGITPIEECVHIASFQDSLNLNQCSSVNQQNETDYKRTGDLLLKRKAHIPAETDEEIILEDLYFDIHMDDEKKEETEKKKDDHKSLTENLKQSDNEDRQILVDHIKRLEHQNEIFLNNLLNMYYVCMDYIKMQDTKIKEKEQIILELKEQIHQKDKIINILQKKNNATIRSPFYAHVNTEFLYMHKK